MKPVCLAVATAVMTSMMLGACVTETTGRRPPVEQPGEASDLNVQLGIGYLRQGDWQSAQVKLERAIAQDPDNVVAHTALGLVYQNLGDASGAERNYRRAVTLAPANPDALNGLAAYLCRQESGRAEALKLFDRALSVPLSTQYSNKAMLFTNAGTCLKGLDLARSEEYLRTALVADPQYAAALFQLADVSFQRGNPLQSRAFLQRHLTVAEPSAAALWLGVRIENAMGDFRAADEFGNRLRFDFPESVETRRLLEQLRDDG